LSFVKIAEFTAAASVEAEQRAEVDDAQDFSPSTLALDAYKSEQRPARVRVRVGLQGPPGGSEALEAVRDENDVDRTQRSEHDHFKAPRLLVADSSENQKRIRLVTRRAACTARTTRRDLGRSAADLLGCAIWQVYPRAPRRVQRFGEQITSASAGWERPGPADRNFG
jgi:hypothetical protein